MDKKTRWRNAGIWLALTWNWLVGGPRLLRRLASIARRAEEAERKTLRETFDKWTLTVRDDDGVLVHIRPRKMTVHIEGPMTDAAFDALRKAWVESGLLMRFPFPVRRIDRAVKITPQGNSRGVVYDPQGDWRLSVMPVTFLEESHESGA